MSLLLQPSPSFRGPPPSPASFRTGVSPFQFQPTAAGPPEDYANFLAAPSLLQQPPPAFIGLNSPFPADAQQADSVMQGDGAMPSSRSAWAAPPMPSYVAPDVGGHLQMGSAPLPSSRLGGGAHVDDLAQAAVSPLASLEEQPKNHSQEEWQVEDDDDDEGRDACEDLRGLLAYFEDLERAGDRIVEATHVVNKWILHGVVVPMKHHGVIFRTRSDSYLRAHLVRDGLAWKVYDSKPGLPDTTCHCKSYEVNSSPAALKKYCRETKPWSWPSNDCAKWARGALQAAGVDEHIYRSMPSPPHMPRGPRKSDVQKIWARVRHPLKPGALPAAKAGAAAGTSQQSPKLSAPSKEVEVQVEVVAPEQRGAGGAIPKSPEKPGDLAGGQTSLPGPAPALLTDLRAYSRVPASALFGKANDFL